MRASSGPSSAVNEPPEAVTRCWPSRLCRARSPECRHGERRRPQELGCRSNRDHVDGTVVVPRANLSRGFPARRSRRCSARRAPARGSGYSRFVRAIAAPHVAAPVVGEVADRMSAAGDRQPRLRADGLGGRVELRPVAVIRLASIHWNVGRPPLASATRSICESKTSPKLSQRHQFCQRVRGRSRGRRRSRRVPDTYRGPAAAERHGCRSGWSA